MKGPTKWEPTGMVLSLVFVSIFLLTTGCAAVTPAGPISGAPPSPPLATLAPRIPGTPTPTSPPLTPVPTAALPIPTPGPPGPPVQESPVVSALLQNMVRFGQQLQGMAQGSPTASDLVAASQRMNETLGWVHQYMGGMSDTERQQALRDVAFLLDWMTRVALNHIGATGGAGPTGATGTPQPTAGTLLMILSGAEPSIPGAPLSNPGQQLQNQTNLIRQHAAELSKGRPTGGDIVVLLRSLESSATTTYQQAPILSAQDLDRLTADMGAAMQEISAAVRVYTGR